ncbi:aldo/keto reductase [Pseudoalteromonas phenolica]|uniref:D-threo-aldose 1-dehydrogenase n=1 Tax=Pseudoalteromonas phenolica TaxID=161398 RepID=A0A0S2K480_9GAMM|nr:aldo/keto reductase [Pseudoalteromonas phenolica]ALO42869.1 D-threo-aldose 1-dehydrogenase [Pseudoalteromonas phenolica]MBE0355996.1 D-threo-aldose 1-dehydrogenase [Pseudoalteromonas phenolica O-BC30]RXE94664.1 aldo/keto reductase [Pseudoalteromonas phenolica O-BC30]
MLNKNQIGNTGLHVTELGFGAATLGNLYRPISDNDAYRAVEKALELGINQFDTAPYYGFGLSERRIGNVLRTENQDDWVLSTKVGRLLKPCANASDKYGFCSPMPFEPEYDYSYNGIMRSVEDSIQRLGLSKIDIVYMHDIGSATHGDQHPVQFKIAESGFRALEELRDQGVIKAIGLGVNEYQVCEQAMEYCKFDCFLLAGRYTLLEQEALTSFLPKCERDNISIILGGPYNSGILATGVKNAKSVPHYDYGPAPKEITQRVADIESVCEEYNVSLASAALQFPLAHPAVVSVIPGLSSANRVESTVKQIKETIPAEFWQTLRDKGLIHCEAPIPGISL